MIKIWFYTNIWELILFDRYIEIYYENKMFSSNDALVSKSGATQ